MPKLVSGYHQGLNNPPSKPLNASRLASLLPPLPSRSRQQHTYESHHRSSCCTNLDARFGDVESTTDSGFAKAKMDEVLMKQVGARGNKRSSTAEPKEPMPTAHASLTRQDVAGTYDELIQSVSSYVKEYMSHYDPSHDYNHIQRVHRLALLILDKESQSDPAARPQYDKTLLTLGALLHDVGDRKYLLPGQDSTTLVRDVLLERGCPADLADRVQDLVLHVSFSSEKKDPQKVLDKIASIPELAIVQDADRLDAIGAVGIARCFTFGGAKMSARGLSGCVDHFEEKLELLEGMMKTGTGRQLARERTERLKVFRGWWESETLGLS